MLVLREEGRRSLEACRGPARLHLRRVRRCGEQTHGRRRGRRPATERRADVLAQTSDTRPKTSARRRRASSRRSVKGEGFRCWVLSTGFFFRQHPSPKTQHLTPNTLFPSYFRGRTVTKIVPSPGRVTRRSSGRSPADCIAARRSSVVLTGCRFACSIRSPC